MLGKMKSLLFLLLLGEALASPTMEDNKLPTDQEILGQPEEVLSLGLPSDEESYNRLSVFFNPPKPATPPFGSGTYHFVSSTFPEVDSRGFHESVFDGIGDYFPSWPSPYKRGDAPHYTPSLAQRLGVRPHTNYRKRSDSLVDPSVERRRRSLAFKNITQDLPSGDENCVEKSCLEKGKKASSLTRNMEKKAIPTNKIMEDKIIPWQNENKSSADKHADINYHSLSKRSSSRGIRGMEMGSSGFHGNIFNSDFGDFTTMRKRARGAQGFYGDTFSDGFGDFTTMKRALKKKRVLSKIKDYLSTLFSSDSTNPGNKISETNPTTTERGFKNGIYGIESRTVKRKPEMDSEELHSEDFNPDSAEFEIFKKRRPAQGSMGFYGDTFSQGFGDFSTLKKRRPEMDSMGFHGDTFSHGFGDFESYKKRRAAQGSQGFFGDTFSQGFGDFSTLKKRRPEMDSMGFHGDTFSGGFGDFEPFKKRRPEMDSMGFHGDTFSGGFGDFEPFKKRRPEMDSMGFYGDTFNRGFGDFEVYKKRSLTPTSQNDAGKQNTAEVKFEDKKPLQRHPDVF